MIDEPGVHPGRVVCQSGKYPPGKEYRQRSTLRTDGTVKLCRETVPARLSGAPGRCGVNCGCLEGIPELWANEAVIVGRYRCTLLRGHVICTITRSGAGFSLNRSTAIRVSQQPPARAAALSLPARTSAHGRHPGIRPPTGWLDGSSPD
jgi:hypothetical protein